MNDTESGVPDDKLAALEQRITALESLVKGMVQEMLDCKAIVMAKSRSAPAPERRVIVEQPNVEAAQEEAAGPEPVPAVPAPQKTTVIRPKSAKPPAAPPAPPEPEMVRIMQSDGTFKMEPRRGSTGTIDSSPRPGGKMVASPKKSGIITASDSSKKKGQN